MYRVCGLRLGPNFGMWLTGGRNFYLPLMAEEMHAFVVFTDKCLRSYGCSGTNLMATVNCTSPKTEIQIQNTNQVQNQNTNHWIQIYFVIKKCFSFLVTNLSVCS